MYMHVLRVFHLSHFCDLKLKDMLARELAALMINLSYNPRVVESMIANRGLNLLMDRFADKKGQVDHWPLHLLSFGRNNLLTSIFAFKIDPLLLKIIRNISLWSYNQQQELEYPEIHYKYRGLWSPHIKLLLETLLEGKFSVE